jgi:hypothetical protein
MEHLRRLCQPWGARSLQQSQRSRPSRPFATPGRPLRRDLTTSRPQTKSSGSLKRAAGRRDDATRSGGRTDRRRAGAVPPAVANDQRSCRTDLLGGQKRDGDHSGPAAPGASMARPLQPAESRSDRHIGSAAEMYEHLAGEQRGNGIRKCGRCPSRGRSGAGEVAGRKCA